jgi:hypothetical protein
VKKENTPLRKCRFGRRKAAKPEKKIRRDGVSVSIASAACGPRRNWPILSGQGPQAVDENRRCESANIEKNVFWDQHGASDPIEVIGHSVQRGALRVNVACQRICDIALKPSRTVMQTKIQPEARNEVRVALQTRGAGHT